MILSQILTADQVPQGSYSATQQTLEHSQTDIVLSTAWEQASAGRSC